MIAFTGPVIGRAPGSPARAPAPTTTSAGRLSRLNAFLEARGIERAHVVAQDTGATIARHAAIHGGGRIASLLLTMVGQIPDCRGLRAVPGASLLVHEEKPDAVAEHALAFYRELRGDRWGQRVRGRQRHQRSSGPE